jgi:hypothetical protein
MAPAPSDSFAVIGLDPCSSALGREHYPGSAALRHDNPDAER